MLNLDKIRNTDFQGILYRGVLASFNIQVGGMVLVFLSNFLFARFTGADVYGIYTYIFTFVSILGGLSILGFDNLLIRDVVRLKLKKQSQELASLLGTAFWVVLGASSTLAALATGFVYFLPQLLTNIAAWMDLEIDLEMLQQNQRVFALGFLAIPLLAILRLWSAALIGDTKIKSGQIGEGIVKPLVFLLGICLLYFGGIHLGAQTIVLLNVLAFGLAVLVVGFLAKKYLNIEYGQTHVSAQTRKIWLLAAWPFFLLSMFTLFKMNADKLLIGTLMDYSTLGKYTIAARLSEILRVLLVMVNTVLAPLIVNLYNDKDSAGLQKLVTQSAWMIFLGGLPIGLGFVFLGKWILSFYGVDFMEAHEVLFILALAQLFNLATGFGASLLMMTGFEKLALKVQVFIFIVEFILHLCLIPRWGMTGAAIATACSIVLYNIILVVLPIKKLGVNPSIFTRVRKGNL